MTPPTGAPRALSRRPVVPALALALALVTAPGAAQDTITLWPGGAPDAQGTAPTDVPQLTVHLPERAASNGAAVIVAPGGGYRILAADHEGLQVARWLNRQGIAAFVLRYRLGPTYTAEQSLQDAQRAVRTVRHRAERLGVSASRVGMLGFSAGGHLTAAAGTSFDAGRPDASDPVERVSSRPDFLVPIYAAISPELFEREIPWAALDEKVTAETPPAFLVHTHRDRVVVPEHSILFYQALHRAGIAAELHIFTHGPHGTGLAPGDPQLAEWPTLLLGWLQRNRFLTDQPRAAVRGEVTVDGKPLYWGWVSLQPEDPTLPAAVSYMGWDAGGRFEIPAEDGPTVGRYRATVHRVSKDFTEKRDGSYSTDDAESWAAGIVTIEPGENVLELEVETP